MKPLDRRKSRYLAIQIIYIHELLKEDLKDVEKKMIEFNNYPDFIKSYAKGIIEKYRDNHYMVDREIRNHLEGWRWEQVGYVERAILKVSVTEMLFIEEISPIIALNEAVELAKGLSTYAAGSFVNGVIGTIYEEKIKN